MEIRSPSFYFALKIILTLVLTGSTSIAFSFENNINLAFYYGHKPPAAQLKVFPNIVFEPGSGINPQEYQTETRTAYAYVSLGETISLEQYAKPLDKSWILGHNPAWKSLVLDQSHPQWQQYFIDNLITPLWEKGYRGFFLDTLDSYRLVTQNEEQAQKQQAGLMKNIQAIKQKYPQAKIILNRGFELLPRMAIPIEGVVAESLFTGWDNAQKKYVAVDKKNRDALIVELNKVNQLGIPVTVIDYLPEDKAQEAVAVADKISALGFHPWITNSTLTAVYLWKESLAAQGFKILPRKILMFYDGRQNHTDDKMNSVTLRTIGMPLNYYGYVTELRNIRDPLPDISAKEYAGVVTYLNSRVLGEEQRLLQWYQQVMAQKIPLLILNHFGFDLNAQNLAFFGLTAPEKTHNAHTLKILFQSPSVNYEIQPILNPADFSAIQLKPDQGTSLLTVADELNVKSDIAAITPWGGYYANEPSIEALENFSYWIMDPFTFLSQALRLPARPVPDTTTENGKRLMLVHVDGDGFVNKGEWYNATYSGDIMRTEIFEKFKIPTTVSIIQGELAPNGLYPKISAEVEDIARKIFLLPWVEIASHSFSHPYNWQDAQENAHKHPNPFILPIPNYIYNLETEIVGSVNYINAQLAPADKKCKVFLWSGQGDVNPQAMAYIDQLNLTTLNPGLIISQYANSMTNVSPLGVNQGPYFQVFAPIGNDFEISHQAESFYSFIQTIDAFKLTDSPRRLKPIDIYFHFYTVAQLGGIKALKEVYEWSLAQSVMNIFASEYAEKVLDFNQLLLLERDGGWLVKTADKLREFRIPTSMGYPDLEKSRNIIGFNTYQNHHYIHIGTGGEAFIKLSSQAPVLPYISAVNSRITYFHRDNSQHLQFSVAGHLPPIFSLTNAQNCHLWHQDQEILPSEKTNDVMHYAFTEGVKYDFSVKCS